MLTTSPLRIHTDILAIAFDVPAGTDLLTVPRPAPPLANLTRAIAQALLAPSGHCHWPRWAPPPTLTKHRRTKLR
jgi:hypothetical protein